MAHERAPGETHLFTLRLWREDRGAGQSEGRGKVVHTRRGEARHLRGWPTLLAFVQVSRGGASMGIGVAGGRGVGREGARVGMAARDEERLRQAADRIREETDADVLAVPADMTRTDDVTRFVQAARARFGCIDVLLNIAGAAPGGTLEDLADESWNAGLDLK